MGTARKAHLLVWREGPVLSRIRWWWQDGEEGKKEVNVCTEDGAGCVRGQWCHLSEQLDRLRQQPVLHMVSKAKAGGALPRAAIGSHEGRGPDSQILLSESARRCQNVDGIIVAATGIVTLSRERDGDQ